MASTDPTTVREIERKYEADEEVRLPEPGPALELAAQVEEQELAAVYFDTADLRLLRNKVTLRRREGGSDAGWHLKLPAGKDSRDELRLPLGRARTKPPAALAELVRVHSRGAALAPVAELVTNRRRYRLSENTSDGGARELAELVDDRVVARTLGAETTTTGWREVEVELAEHGDVALLDRVEAWLGGLGVHRSRSSSKLGRLLAERVAAVADDGPPGTTPEPGSAGEAVLDHLRAQVDALRRHDPLVRRDAPDAVHQMRVAARRMRSTLQIFRDVLDRDRTRSRIEELRWMAGELAPARDAEVMAERLTAMLDELPDELLLGPVRADLERAFQRRRADGQRRAIAALDSDRYLRLHDALDSLLADPPLAARAGRRADKELPRAVRRAYRRLAARMTAVEKLAPGARRDEALHEARKAVKRLRYATEASAPAVGEPARRLRDQLKPLQELLGDHQDTVVARPVLRELAARTHAEGGNGFTYGVLHGLEASRADRLEAALPGAWQQLREPENVRWLD